MRRKKNDKQTFFRVLSGQTNTKSRCRPDRGPRLMLWRTSLTRRRSNSPRPGREAARFVKPRDRTTNCKFGVLYNGKR
ncbi:uncharacterized protein PgNI_01477, partial [Pyricularia grisea]|uniref:Uncharacterized protein n=1 Tax=Pyricularia grisea TaxID=148305 RepID=A0A6P8BGG2_PYRGI